MNRRHFLRRATGLAAGLMVPRWARAQTTPTDSTAARPGTAAARPDTSAAPPDAAAARPDTTAAPASPSVLIAAGGDTTLGYNLEAHFDQQLEAGVPRESLWPIYFAGVKSILEAADLAVVNLECPFTERGRKLAKNFNFRARRELVRILQEGSVDVVSLANNHINDWGRDGVKDTIRTLDQAGIEHFGAGMNLEHARRPAILERNGMKLGFLGYYFQAAPDMLEPEEVYATKRRAGVAGCYKDLACVRDQMTEDLRRLAPQVDAVIPFFHWGKEGSHEVRAYQVELAHLCVDLGAKAVLGSHPHRPQGVEVYNGAPIFYSLGNFVYGGIKEPKDTLTMIARIRLTRGPANGDAHPATGVEADVTPVQFTRWPEKPFQPFVLEGEAREAAMSRVASYSRGLERTLPQLEPYRAALPAAASPSEP